MISFELSPGAMVRPIKEGIIMMDRMGRDFKCALVKEREPCLVLGSFPYVPNTNHLNRFYYKVLTSGGQVGWVRDIDVEAM